MSIEEDGAAVLASESYEVVRDAADTFRKALVVRLCGEAGLRPAEIARLSPSAVTRVRDDPPRYVLSVPSADGTNRTAYLPADLQRDFTRYVRSNGVDDDERVFDVSPRRLQMLVSEVAERASERTGDPSLSSVSSSDLRRYFAHRALVVDDVNPRVVKAAGGWRSFEALEPYLSPPTEAEIVEAFDPVERSAPEWEARAGADASDREGGVIRSLLAATDRCGLLRLDPRGYVDHWNRSAASTLGYRANETVGTHVSTFYTDEDVTDGVPDRILSVAAEESGHETEGWRIRKDGSRFWALETVSPLRDDDGELRGYAVLVCDVSRHHERLATVRGERDELALLYEVGRRQRAVTRALLDSTTHEQVETGTCEALTAGDTYDFAWIDRKVLSDGRREWRTASGVEPSVVERLSDSTADVEGRGPDDSISITRDVTVDTGDGGQFDGDVATVALEYGDTVYGTLSIGTDRRETFGDRECDWLRTVARQVGFAIGAVRRRNLLLSDTLVELEFVCRDDRSYFAAASAQLACRFELISLVEISEATKLYYVHLEGASPTAVFDLADADPGIDDYRLIETYEDGWRIEFVVSGSSPALTLTEYGATVLECQAEDGKATILAECAVDADLRTIVGGLRSAYPESELRGKREVERSVQTARAFREGIEDRLTDRQVTALRAAYFGGYYDWPRESTAEEVADAMGVSSPTLHNHLRKGQHELLRTFFDAAIDE